MLKRILVTGGNGTDPETPSSSAHQRAVSETWAAAIRQGARNTTVGINIAPRGHRECVLTSAFSGDTSFVTIHQNADVSAPIHHDTLHSRQGHRGCIDTSTI